MGNRSGKYLLIKLILLLLTFFIAACNKGEKDPKQAAPDIPYVDSKSTDDTAYNNMVDSDNADKSAGNERKLEDNGENKMKDTIITENTTKNTTENATEDTTEVIIEASIKEQNKALQPAATAIPSEEILVSPAIIVKKSERLLELWDGDKLYGSYSIGLGWEPNGDKKAEGDGRTPEGSYYVCTRNSQSRFYLSLGVSYPNKEDAEEAFDANIIDQPTYNQIEEAISAQRQPPWNTALGGEIMIHGMGGQSDWTAGCIAVDNEVMDILWRNCPMNTPITIEP